jgi:preprotein translocase subunit SecE
MNKLVSYLKESFEEVVHKVSWPAYNELQQSSVLVIVASVLFAIVVFAIDYSFEQLLEIIY